MGLIPSMQNSLFYFIFWIPDKALEAALSIGSLLKEAYFHANKFLYKWISHNNTESQLVFLNSCHEVLSYYMLHE